MSLMKDETQMDNKYVKCLIALIYNELQIKTNHHYSPKTLTKFKENKAGIEKGLEKTHHLLWKDCKLV